LVADLEPHLRNAGEALNQLIRITDDRELYDAIVELLKAEGRAPSLAPT
jgi:hypothetical protein